MNSGIDSGPPTMKIAGGWTCEPIVLGPEHQAGANGAAIGSSTLELWYPEDADAVVEQQIQSGNEEDPFWCYLWPTARTLCQQVFSATCLSLAHSAKPLHVLETGCGIGLVGLAALVAGATTVTFQDLRSRSVDLALHNAQANGFGDRARGETFDWRSPPTQTFDWIMASDVLYHSPVHEHLLYFLERAIHVPNGTANALSDTVSTASCLGKQPQQPQSPSTTLAILTELSIRGSIWIGDPGRREAEAFIQLATPHFHVHLFDAQGMPLSSPNYGEYQLMVMHPRG